MKFSQNNLLPYDGEVYHFKNYISDPERRLQQLLEELKWRDDKIKMFGKLYSQKRKVAWNGDPGTEYTYSKIKMTAHGWTPGLLEIKQRFFKDYQLFFNSVLSNYYRHGDDYMSWHQDNELELGEKPIIASISLGAGRDFHFKHVHTEEKKSIFLNSGELLIMQGQTQNFWKHCLPKRKKVKTGRLNLTFRNILAI